jgi:beta-N-acetylhexosaminidase
MRGGRVLFVGFEGSALTHEERTILRRIRPGGLVLLPRNIDDEPGLTALVRELRDLCPDAILALDSEGGRVDRLRALIGPAPSALHLAAHPSRLARRSGRWVGASLASFGFDLDFAPVVDLDHGRIGNALDGRCFGSTPRAVIARAGAFLSGLEAAGIGGCLKHFPGLGAAGEDTHLETTSIGLSAREIARDLAPFRALAARSGSMMAGHAVYPEIDPQELPATLSPAVSTGLLRGDLGYRGTLLSDDLEMGALGRFGDLPARAEAALGAGCDGLLFCRRLDEAPEIAGRLGRSRLAKHRGRAEERVERLRRRLRRLRRSAAPPPALEIVRCRLAAVTAAASA